MTRAFPLSWGAQLEPGGVRFRLWAPAATSVSAVISVEKGQRVVPLERAGDGWFECVDSDCDVGTLYAYEIDGRRRVPDPAARFAPEGPGKPCEVIDPRAFDWPQLRPPRALEEMVFYELHVGTFTPDGTYEGAVRHLDHLVDLGITAIELMPLAERPGRRNWGYDGVLLYAPASVYGRPDDLKRLVVAAHEAGLAVFLDVVYNHFGPQDNYLSVYAPQFFTEKHHTPWGAAIDYSSAGNEPVRRFAIENAGYWLYEYGFDGLRLDATQEIYDDRKVHVLGELAEQARVAAGRRVYLVAENDRNDVENLRRGFDALWNDDVHHCLHVALTGERDGYYQDYVRDPIGLLGRALTEGFAFQGEPSPFRDGRRRGGSTNGVPLAAFVNCLQNHDQIGNRAFGERIGQLAPPRAVRAAIAALLLAPSPPLLFMGEEWAASSPFLYFCDFEPELARRVTEGRRGEFARFAQFSDPKAREHIPDPSSPQAFSRSVLDWSEVPFGAHREMLDHYRDLLHVRRREIVKRVSGVSSGQGDFCMRGARGLIARWRLNDGARLTLEANLGPEPESGFASPSSGRVIYATEDFDAGVAPAWSVRWSLE